MGNTPLIYGGNGELPMPWKETSPMDQREQFLADHRRGHFTMQELCVRYAISRKTGHKWVGRVAEEGRRGLADRSSAPSTRFVPNTITKVRTRIRTARHPGARYTASLRPYPSKLPPLEYAEHFRVKRATGAGAIRFQQRLLYFANAVDTFCVGLEEIDDGIWSIYFGTVLLARFDERNGIIRE